MSEQLKPCPFCGGEKVQAWEESPVPDDYMLYGVGCLSCCVQTELKDTEEEAIEAWNTRAERMCNVSYSYNPVTGGRTLIRGRCECGEVVCECLEMRSGEVPAAIWQKRYPNYCPNCGAKVVSRNERPIPF